MIGSPALVLGIGREYAEGDMLWDRYQMFTFEEYINYKHDEYLTEYAKKQKKFHGKSIHFANLNKIVPVLRCAHSFDFKDAVQVEITLDELKLLHKDLNEDQWQKFDEETWGK